MAASVSHIDRVHDLPGVHRRERGSSLAPTVFHSAVPFASLISTDDFGAASYISPPP
ncbi:MAG TPA: hypothetical protein VHA35_01960 [Dongiaceae bacterium]|nr:hypothetical protein [Dongiaceae bacterium]